MNNKNKPFVRIMAWILTILMILSIATLTISIFVEQCGETEVAHDHDGDGKPDHDDAGHTEDGEIDDGNADIGDDIFD